MTSALAPALSDDATTTMLARLPHLSDAELSDLLPVLADIPDAVDAILAELDAREAAPLAQVITLPVQQEAPADAPPVTVDDEKRAWLNDQREIVNGKRETIVQCADRLYGEMIDERVVLAEEATRGHMVTKQAISAHIEVRSLFFGNASRAVKWASDELLQWWEENGRPSWAEWMLQTTGHARYAVDARKAREQWADYLIKGRNRRREEAARKPGAGIRKFGARD